MVQMPLVVLVAAAAVRRIEEDRRGRSLPVGVAAGLAALRFVSNALLGVTLAAALAWRHLRRREARRAAASVAAIAAGMTLAAGPPLLAAWLPRAHAIGFFDWLTRYDGGFSPTRVTAHYGVVASLSGVLTALVRAAYGAASSLVDLAAPAATWRDRQPLTLAALMPALAFAAAVTALAIYALAAWRAAPNGRGERSPALPLTIAWVSAIFAFGVFWDNSDDQFYFQLAPIFGVIAAGGPASPRHVARHGPRYGRPALERRRRRDAPAPLPARGTRGADRARGRRRLPGRLPRLRRAAAPPRPLASNGEGAAPEPRRAGGRRAARRRAVAPAGARRCLPCSRRPRRPARHLRNAALRSPWKYLLRLGYERRAVESALASVAGETASAASGPFTVREISPPPAGNRRAPGS